jgi:hypothetical protein
MPGFRIFYVDAASGHITGSQDFNDVDDLDVVRRAAEYRTDGVMGLWCENRRIKTWEAASPSAKFRPS